MTHRTASWVLGSALLGLVLGCSTPPPAIQTAPDAPDDALIIVAIDDAADPMPSVGATPRADYRLAPGYGGSARAASVAGELASDHALYEQAAWTIAPLRLRCMLYRIAPGADRAAVLAELGRDARVQLAQPQNRFETLAAPYNDPYVGLQRGFASIDAAAAQRWSSGDGVRIALIDSGVDATHPDLAGQLLAQRDFVGAAHPAPSAGEAHGTGVAGVIAARANNAIGIVGVAPRAHLLAYRACWGVAGAAGASRCDSFTLAQALGAAIAADADIINLSLGGPADPLLERLARHAIERGAIVVGALPPGGRRDGFPAGVRGVLAVASADDSPAAPGVLIAPGRDILTLTPAGHYDYASGSSLAAAHVSGAIALLRALDPSLRAATVQRWLEAGGAAPLDVCAAVQRLRPAALCGAGISATR